MEVQNVQLTIIDILNIHRDWIIKLYREDLKTEEEIVEQLREKGLAPTTFQIHQCLEDWGIIHIPSPTYTSYRPDGKPRLRRVLPTSTDRLRVTCYHGAESHEAETTLENIQEGPTQLDVYRSDLQNHERIAVGLDRYSGSRGSHHHESRDSRRQHKLPVKARRKGGRKKSKALDKEADREGKET